MKAADHTWRAVEKSLHAPRVECLLCPRKCVLKDGQRGFCYVRKNEGGAMHLTSYGRTSGLAMDPIEKKPLYHFLPGSKVLSFGGVGCNLGCQFCQNWHISKASSDELLSSPIPPKELASLAVRHGGRSVAVTYNEPITFFEYARDVAVESRKRQLKTVAVTAGYITEAACPSFFSNFDAANVDLKSFSPTFYRSLCHASLEPVLRTLKYLATTESGRKTWLEITTLVIPGHNDSTEEIEKLCRYVKEELGPFIPLHFSAFHPDYKMTEVPRTPAETLFRCKDVAVRCGLHYVYCGEHPLFRRIDNTVPPLPTSSDRKDRLRGYSLSRETRRYLRALRDADTWMLLLN